MDGYEQSPVIHLCLSDFRGSREAGQKLLDTIVKESLEEGVAIVTAKYLESEEHKLPQQRYETCFLLLGMWSISGNPKIVLDHMCICTVLFISHYFILLLYTTLERINLHGEELPIYTTTKDFNYTVTVSTLNLE